MEKPIPTTSAAATPMCFSSFGTSGYMSRSFWRMLNCTSTDSCYMIAATLLVLVFGYAQKIFGGMRVFLVDDVHCKTVRRKMDSEMEEEFLDCIFGISSNWAPFKPNHTNDGLNFSPQKTKKHQETSM